MAIIESVSSIRYTLACKYIKDSYQSPHLHRLISLSFLSEEKLDHWLIHTSAVKDSDLTANIYAHADLSIRFGSHAILYLSYYPRLFCKPIHAHFLFLILFE